MSKAITNNSPVRSNGSNRQGKIERQGEFFPIQMNVSIEGTLIGFRKIKDRLNKDETAEIDVADIKLAVAHVCEATDKHPAREFQEGAIVTYTIKAGARGLMQHEPGTEFRLTPIAKKDTGKPSPAWIFELEIFEEGPDAF